MDNILGVVYDCDGVLFESRQANLAFYNTILQRFSAGSVPADDAQIAQLCHTASSPQVLKVLLGEERAVEALAYAMTLDYRDFVPFMFPEPGLSLALEKISQRFPVALATNRGGSAPELIKHFGLGEFFSTIVTSHDVPRPKPHPDMLLLVSERFGVTPERLVFVGDSDADYQAAKAAGMPFVAYKWLPPSGVSVNGHLELAELLVG